jgi:hypothetical protein
MAGEKGNTPKGAGSRDTVKSTRQDDVVWKHLDRLAVFISFLGDGAMLSYRARSPREDNMIPNFML